VQVSAEDRRVTSQWCQRVVRAALLNLCRNRSRQVGRELLVPVARRPRVPGRGEQLRTEQRTVTAATAVTRSWSLSDSDSKWTRNARSDGLRVSTPSSTLDSD
jgi:hypothetical protein